MVESEDRPHIDLFRSEGQPGFIFFCEAQQFVDVLSYFHHECIFDLPVIHIELDVGAKVFNTGDLGVNVSQVSFNSTIPV